MVRRRLTLKRVDPWSTLKFGFVVNLSLLAIGLLGAAVLWFFVRRLGLIERVCSIATDVGFETCGVDGGNLFRAVLLLGLLGVVIMTGVAVFLAFLANLISDLTGGLSFSFVDDTAGAAGRGEAAGAPRSVTARDPQALGTNVRSDAGASRSAPQPTRPTPGSGASPAVSGAGGRSAAGEAGTGGPGPWTARDDDAIFRRGGDETERR